MLRLGPMPTDVAHSVRRLIHERPIKSGDFPNWLLLWGGPGGCDYLDENGDVWEWSGFDGSVQLVVDGPRKVGAIAIASQTIPELTPWLPARSAGASDCELCQKPDGFNHRSPIFFVRNVMGWAGFPSR